MSVRSVLRISLCDVPELINIHSHPYNIKQLTWWRNETGSGVGLAFTLTRVRLPTLAPSPV